MQLHNTLIDLLADARGKERHIRFIDGEPQPPEVIDDLLQFPDAIGVIP